MAHEQEEYKPTSDIQESRIKLAELSRQIDITPRQLYESALTILVSRGGARWKDAADITLRTDSRLSALISIVFYQKGHYDSLAMLIVGPGAKEVPESNAHSYEIRKYNTGEYEVGEIFPNETDDPEFR